MELTDLHKRFIDLSNPLEPQETGTIPRLRKLAGIRLLAYDFYGTLFLSGVGDIGVDDGSFDADILIETFENSGIKIKNNEAGSEGFLTYNQIVKGMIEGLREQGVEYPEPDIREVWTAVLKKMEADDLIEYDKSKPVSERLSVEFEARMNPVWPVPGVVETLHYFKKEGFPQGIISNSQFYTPVVLEALTGQTLTELGFSDEILHWSFEEMRKKPGLTFYKNFIEKLYRFDHSIRPENVLYIGNDMLKDVYPAHEVGMKTALFAGDKRSLKWRRDDDRCKNLVPDLVITKLPQLKKCV
ncbi:MAG: HAD family hydrolase [Balneolaceae bacterium]|nr:HAD family hydrolase [Balneolaceae bacterium]